VMIDIATASPRIRCAYDHRLRAQVVRVGTRCLPQHIRIPRSTVSTWRRRGQRPVVIEQHNTQMPHSAFAGQTPDEMCFGTAVDLPAQLAAARNKARAERLAANRAMTCSECSGQRASLPESPIPT
jgi:hypothetical protein